MTPDFSKFLDGLGDVFKLLKHRGDIREAASRTVDAAHQAAKSAAVATNTAAIAAADFEVAAREAKALKDLIVKATE